MEFSYKDILNKKANLISQAIYKSNSPEDRNYQHFKDHVLTKLFPVKNQGGIRFLGSVSPFNVKFVVFYSNGEHSEWNDNYNKETNKFICYGDNDGKYDNFLETKLQGNKILKEIFELAESKSINKRKKIPPFFITTKNRNKDIIYIGLGVPSFKNGVAEIEEIEMNNTKKTFKNYRATFDILKIDKIDIKWIDDILKNKTFESEYLPKKFDNYINFKNKLDEKIIKEIENEDFGKDKEAILKVRIGHGAFKKKLLKKGCYCKICNMSNEDFLIASHIKPWAASNEKEKVDVDNGFLLCPNHDSLFDKGYISFDNDGKIIISSKLSEEDKIKLNINSSMKITLSDNNTRYLKYHREKIFKE